MAPFRKIGLIALLGLFILNLAWAQDSKSNVIRESDKINILVIQADKVIFKETLVVSQNGDVLISLLGKAKAAGQTVSAFETKLTQLFSQKYQNPSVSVTIEPVTNARRNIYLLGEVKDPGAKQVKNSVTITKAIAMAGGFTSEADTTVIRIIRKNQAKVGEVFNWKLYNQGKVKAPVINPDDVVLVEKRKAAHFFILGAVNSSGRYSISRDISFLEAISMAGGLVQNNTSPDATIVKKDGKVQTIGNIRQKLTSKEVTSLMISPGDTIVLAVSAKSAITVMGAVVNPGRYAIKGDSANLLRAISLAGGLNSEAGTASIIGTDGSIQSVDLRQISRISNTSELPPVPAGATVMVNRAVPQQVYVFGRVKAPGAYNITGPVGLHQALAMAGDISKWGSRSGIKILRANGKIETFDLQTALEGSSAGKIPQLKAGDTLYVP